MRTQGNPAANAAKALGGVLAVAILALVTAMLPARAADTDVRLFDASRLEISANTAAITTTAADFTTWQPMVTVAPQTGFGMWDCKIAIDLDKTTTGFASTYTSGTITFSIARKVDGTNWRTSTNVATTAISGTNSSGLMIELNIGAVGPNEQVRVMMKVSAESNSNTALPYVFYYRAGARAVLTPAS